MITKLGNPVACTFQCKRLIAGVMTLFDPTVVKCSWRKPGPIEDCQLYLGAAPRDNLLTKISTGIYQAIYVTDVLGKWECAPYWSYTSGGLTLTYSAVSPGSFRVDAQPFGFTDSP